MCMALWGDFMSITYAMSQRRDTCLYTIKYCIHIQDKY